MVTTVRRQASLAATLASTLALACSSPSNGSTSDAELLQREPIAASGDMVVIAAAAPAPPLETGPMAVYLVLGNRGSQPDTLLGVTSPSTSRGDIHATSTANGMSGMGPAGALPINPGEVLRMAPGGLHVMLDGLTAPIQAGDSLVLNLQLSRTGEVTFTIPVVTYADVQRLLVTDAGAPSGD